MDVPFGDPGLSLVIQTPVSVRTVVRLPTTLELTIAVTVVAVVIMIPLGILSATRCHEPVGCNATVLSLASISTPDFWLGVMPVFILTV